MGDGGKEMYASCFSDSRVWQRYVFLEEEFKFLQKTKCDGDPLNFFKMVSGVMTTLQWKAIYPRICGQHKLDLIGILKRKKGCYEVGWVEKGS